MSETKHRPVIRFKGFDDDWEQRKFIEITYPAGTKNKENMAYESYSVTNEKGFTPQNEQFENGGIMATADKSMYYIVTPNSFAYNPARINVGSIGYYDKSENVIVSSLYEVFKATDEIDDRFLWHWFKSESFQRKVEQYQEGGVRLYFYYDKLCRCTLYVPKINEQTRIGKCLDSLDHLITLHQRKYDRLVKLKKSMLEKLFPKNGSKIPEIRFAGFSDDWEQRKLGEIATFINGRAYSQSELLSEGKYKVLRVGNFYTNDSWYYSDLELGEKYYANYGDFLYTWSATFGPHIWLGDKVIYHYHIWKIILSDALERHFAVQLLEQDKANILSNKNGSTMVHVTKEGMEDKDVIIPSDVMEQATIGRLFRTLDHLITLHQRKLEKLKKIKTSMLEKMFV